MFAVDSYPRRTAETDGERDLTRRNVEPGTGNIKTSLDGGGFPGGGGIPIYGLYRYVPRNRVWFLRFSVLK